MTPPDHGVHVLRGMSELTHNVRLPLTKNPTRRSFSCAWCQVHGISFSRFPLDLKPTLGLSGMALPHSPNDHRNTQTLPRRQRGDTVGRGLKSLVMYICANALFYQTVQQHAFHFGLVFNIILMNIMNLIKKK